MPNMWPGDGEVVMGLQPPPFQPPPRLSLTSTVDNRNNREFANFKVLDTSTQLGF